MKRTDSWKKRISSSCSSWVEQTRAARGRTSNVTSWFGAPCQAFGGVGLEGELRASHVGVALGTG